MLAWGLLIGKGMTSSSSRRMDSFSSAARFALGSVSAAKICSCSCRSALKSVSARPLWDSAVAAFGEVAPESLRAARLAAASISGPPASAPSSLNLTLSAASLRPPLNSILKGAVSLASLRSSSLARQASLSISYSC